MRSPRQLRAPPCCRGDIADPATGAALVDLAVSRFGKLDVLVNNAGVFNPKPFLELTEADYDWYLDTILKGKFFTAQAAPGR